MGAVVSDEPAPTDMDDTDAHIAEFSKLAFDKIDDILECPNAARWRRRSSNASTACESIDSIVGLDDADESDYDEHLGLEDVYKIDENSIGEGTYGSVYKGECYRTGAIRAIKKIAKGHDEDLAELEQEIGAMKRMDHPNVIKLHEVFEDKEHSFLVMELCEGSDLFECVVKSGHLAEREAASVMQQILSAVSYMHEQRVIHRDLKPENFLLLSAVPIEQNIIKLIDFGLSCYTEPGTIHNEVVGTPHYTAPEVINRRYSELCDLWSCGVILYVLLCGHTPFGGRHAAEIYSKVREGRYAFQGSVWWEVSDGAKNLIQQLLEKRPDKRCSAEQALAHEWLASVPPWTLLEEAAPVAS